MQPILSYFASLNPMNLLKSLPGGIAQGLIWGIMALGVYITFRLLDFADLTVDGSFTTGGACSVMLITAGVPAWLSRLTGIEQGTPFPAWLALLIATIAGMLAGLCTGLLHTRLGIPAILSGILTQLALYSINLRIMGMASNKAVSVDKYNLILSSRQVGASIFIGAVWAAVLIAAFYWYFGTEQGSAIRATGSNPAMSRALGINIDTMKVIALALSNAVVALAGGLMAQYQGFADINMGRGAIVIGLAAVIIGEVIGESLFKKKLSFWLRLAFVVLGGAIYYTVVVIVLWLKLNSNDLKLFTAVIVAIFLAVPYLRGRAKAPSAGKKGAKTDA